MTTRSELQCGKDFRINPDTNDVIINYKDDFNIISYYENLKQAIIHRLKTNQGELRYHPNYGSKLHTLVGQVGNALLLTRARQYTREALLQEPRINTIKTIKAYYKTSLKNEMGIEITVTPIGSQSNPLNIVYDFIIGGDGI
jgi:phage baseplate assembly protein W